MTRPRCEWCRHLIRAKPLGRTPRFCSASCRQLAYKRRLLEQRKQGEADAINAAQFPNWAGRENVPPYVKHLLAQPQLPPRRRPRRLRCPACKFWYVVKKRGPVPRTCSDRCALALKFYRAVQTATGRPIKLLYADIVANALLNQRSAPPDLRRARHQSIIDDILAPIKTATKRKPRDPER
jgi:hypothetical protein